MDQNSTDREQPTSSQDQSAPSLEAQQARQGEIIFNSRPKQRRMIFFVIAMVVVLGLVFLAIG